MGNTNSNTNSNTSHNRNHKKKVINMDKHKKLKDEKGENKMAVSKAYVPLLKSDIAKIFKEDIESTEINIDAIKGGKKLLDKLIQQRLSYKNERNK